MIIIIQFTQFSMFSFLSYCVITDSHFDHISWTIAWLSTRCLLTSEYELHAVSEMSGTWYSTSVVHVYLSLYCLTDASPRSGLFSLLMKYMFLFHMHPERSLSLQTVFSFQTSGCHYGNNVVCQSDSIISPNALGMIPSMKACLCNCLPSGFFKYLFVGYHGQWWRYVNELDFF